ncbi:hypothetical protein [Clostridium perfringens]|nr:hypothetical protein [Clostridium perfringens]MBO3421278.1 hypothetical protein [Clostridium perfringens]
MVRLWTCLKENTYMIEINNYIINEKIDTLLLEYTSNGEISKSIQNLNWNTRIITIDNETI